MQLHWQRSLFNTDCKGATVAKVAVSENMSATGSKSPGELVVPGKSPPVYKAKDKAIVAIATDLDATALAKDSSSKTIMTATKVAKVAVSKKVRIMFSYFFYYEFIHS